MEKNNKNIGIEGNKHKGQKNKKVIKTNKNLYNWTCQSGIKTLVIEFCLFQIIPIAQAFKSYS